MICPRTIYRDRVIIVRVFHSDTATTAQIRRDSLIVAKVGVPGPAGPAGTPGAGYIHTQSVAASVWTINHNLGYKPAVTALTVGGLEMEVEVLHISINQTQISLVAAMAGTARLT